MSNIDAINSITDKAMELIVNISILNTSVQKLSDSPDKEYILQVLSKQAKSLEMSFDEYRRALLNAVEEIAQENKEDTLETRISKDENGFRL